MLLQEKLLANSNNLKLNYNFSSTDKIVPIVG